MTRLRAAKIAGIAKDIPRVDLDDEDGAELLVLLVGRHVGRGDRGGAPHPRARPARSRTRTCAT